MKQQGDVCIISTISFVSFWFSKRNHVYTKTHVTIWGDFAADAVDLPDLCSAVTERLLNTLCTFQLGYTDNFALQQQQNKTKKVAIEGT